MNPDIDDIDDPELLEKLQELKQEQEQEIQRRYAIGEIIDYSKNINGHGKKTKSKQKQQQQSLSNNLSIISEKEKERNIILNEIIRIRQNNRDLSFDQWSITLNEKYQKLKDKINEYFPEMLLPLDFALSIKTILNIDDITLPFMGILFAVPSSMKSKVFEIFQKWIYSYSTDKFTAKSFVSHSATVAKDKLKEVDMLPRIKDKLLLTPELSPLFTGKEEDIKEHFGIITRVLDGKGLLTESGVHGQRGYEGDYLFAWIGAAVDIPHYVYKFLSTIGFKIYFLRLPRTSVTCDDLVQQLLSDKPFNEKIKEIEKLLLDYLTWFEICPISIDHDNKIAKIEWDKSKDDREAITIIAELAQLLSHLRGSVTVYKSSKTDDFIPLENSESQHGHANTTVNYQLHQPKEFIHGLPIIENPSRAGQQLYNLARGHALSEGRNYITKDDISLIIKVVLSTGSIERVLVLDLLIANRGTLTTSQITTSMKISNSTAKRTMTEFKGLEVVTMEQIGENFNSEYKIILNPEFNWFLTDEFKELRDDFKPTDNKSRIQKFTSNSTNYNIEEDKNTIKNNEKSEQKNFCCDQKTPCVSEENISQNNIPMTMAQTNQWQSKEEIENEDKRYSIDNKNDPIISETNNIDLHRGEKCRSNNENALVDQQQIPLAKHREFNNPLISEADLANGNYQPEIINNINRFEGTDRWFCNNCTMRDDKWFMMKHPCNNNKKRGTTRN